MRFSEEVVPAEKAAEGGAEHVHVPAEELKAAEKLVESMSRDFDPKRYRNEHADRVREVLEEKAKGHEVVAPPPTVEEHRGKVFNLMAALEASLAEAKDKAGSHGKADANGKAKHKATTHHKRKKSA
jgi:DNA end-binding protein Ku